MSQPFVHLSDLAEIKGRPPVFLAIGVFDGVHLGHQQILQRMVMEADAAGAVPAVLTFFPHPVTVIRGRQGRLYLTTLKERVKRLAATGIRLIITYPFNETVRQTRATDFIDELDHHLNLCQLWGGSFSLGYEREGDLAFLSRLGESRGFTVHQFSELVEWSGRPVSSSRIRHSLANGALTDVNGCLGQPFCLSGEVITGDKRGRTIGFPTANLAVWSEQMLPANGVYAAWALINQQRHMAATNIGLRPTVGGSRLSVEAHLLDFDGDLYGQKMTLEFVSRIRDEQKFDGLDALVAQIQADVNQVRWLLDGRKTG